MDEAMNLNNMMTGNLPVQGTGFSSEGKQVVASPLGNVSIDSDNEVSAEKQSLPAAPSEEKSAAKEEVTVPSSMANITDEVVDADLEAKKIEKEASAEVTSDVNQSSPTLAEVAETLPKDTVTELAKSAEPIIEAPIINAEIVEEKDNQKSSEDEVLEKPTEYETAKKEEQVMEAELAVKESETESEISAPVIEEVSVPVKEEPKSEVAKPVDPSPKLEEEPAAEPAKEVPAKEEAPIEKAVETEEKVSSPVETEVSPETEEELRAVFKSIQEEGNVLTNHSKNEAIFSNMDFGPLKKYLDDDNVTDISYSNNGQVHLKTLDKGIYRIDEPAINDALLEKIAFQCANVMGKSFNMAHPFLDAESSELRMNFVHSSIARNGIATVFRKTPAKIRLEREKILEDKYVTIDILDFLISAVKGHCNILVCGETGSGKTELVKFLASHTDKTEKLITIEDTLELHLDRIYPTRDIVSMKTNNIASYSDVLVTCMRQNPKWILLSEVRSAEAVLAVRNSISSGHNILSTLHADKASNIPERLYSLLESNSDLEQFLGTIYRYIQLGVMVRGRYSKQAGRFVREVAEVCEFYVDGNNKPVSNIIYKKAVSGYEEYNKVSDHLIEYLEGQNIDVTEIKKIGADKITNDEISFDELNQNIMLPVEEVPNMAQANIGVNPFLEHVNNQTVSLEQLGVNQQVASQVPNNGGLEVNLQPPINNQNQQLHQMKDMPVNEVGIPSQAANQNINPAYPQVMLEPKPNNEMKQMPINSV